MKAADKVFAMACIDAGFPPYRAVHLSQKCGWYLHKIHPAQHCCGGKAGNVAHDSASQRYNQGRAFATIRQYPFLQSLQGFKCFALLPGGNDRISDTKSGILDAREVLPQWSRKGTVLFERELNGAGTC